MKRVSHRFSAATAAASPAVTHLATRPGSMALKMPDTMHSMMEKKGTFCTNCISVVLSLHHMERIHYPFIMQQKTGSKASS